MTPTSRVVRPCRNKAPAPTAPYTAQLSPSHGFLSPLGIKDDQLAGITAPSGPSYRIFHHRLKGHIDLRFGFPMIQRATMLLARVATYDKRDAHFRMEPAES
jgi:hypothetical protein